MRNKKLKNVKKQTKFSFGDKATLSAAIMIGSMLLWAYFCPDQSWWIPFGISLVIGVYIFKYL